MKRLLSEREVEREFGITVSKLQRDRLMGQGLPYYKVGSLVRYRVDDIEAWLQAQRRGPVIPTQATRTAAEAV